MTEKYPKCPDTARLIKQAESAGRRVADAIERLKDALDEKEILLPAQGKKSVDILEKHYGEIR